MKKLTSIKFKLKNIYSIFLCLIIIVLIFLKPTEIKEGINNGILLCLEIIVPSLFPFTIVSLFMFNSGIIYYLGKAVSPITKILFNLNETTFGVFVLSLIAGYPVGAKLINKMYEKEVITKAKAEHMLCYCVNAGPAFTIIAVGVGLLNSKKLGIILFFSNILASLSLSFIFARFEKRKEYIETTNKKESFISAFVNSTADATHSMINICSWIILFSVINEIIKIIIRNPTANLIITCFLEVSNGIIKLSNNGNIYDIAFLLSFAGFSVHMQVISSFKNFKVSYLLFFIFKIISGVVSTLICGILLKFFPVTTATFSSFNQETIQVNSNSIPLFVMLLLTTISFMAFYKSGRKI